MLEDVVQALLEALGAAGLRAVRAFRREELRSCEGPLICVGVKSAKGLPAGFGGYLGLGTDPETGLSAELYGARCELELALDIYAAEGAENGPAECLRCAELIVPALGALPEGLRIASMEFGRTLYDGETGRFVCHGVLEAAAHFIAREGKQDGEFTGFILRGRVEK